MRSLADWGEAGWPKAPFRRGAKAGGEAMLAVQAAAARDAPGPAERVTSAVRRRGLARSNAPPSAKDGGFAFGRGSSGNAKRRSALPRSPG